MNTVWYDYSKVESRNGTAVAMGNFDGLHKGHMKLISMLMDVSQDNGLHSVAYTFDVHPINAIKGENTLKLIADNDYKQELLSTCDLDTLFFEKFEDVKDLSPEEFVDKILVERFNATALCCGFNYRFGKGAKGDVKLLKRLCAEREIKLTVCEEVDFEETPVSSTRIRECIKNGDIVKANKMLGRYFSFDFQVVHGDDCNAVFNGID